MHSMNKHFFSILAGWALSACMASCSSADNVGLPATSHAAGTPGAEEQYQAIALSFVEPASVHTCRTYPAAYGGAYINDEGALTVRLTTQDADLQRELCEVAGSDALHFELCDYSLTELERTMDEVDECLKAGSGTPALDNIVSAGIDIRSNRVVVELRRCHEQDMAAFRTAVCDSPRLSFVQSASVDAHAESVPVGEAKSLFTVGVINPDKKNPSLSAGDRIWSPMGLGPLDSLNPASVGYRARTADGVYGYVSSALAVKRTGSPVYTRDEKGGLVNVGTVIKRRNEGDVDAVFCAVDFWRVFVSDSITVGTERLIYRAPIVSTWPLPNYYVLMYGAQTIENTGTASYGQIVNSRCTFVGPGNITYTNVVRATYRASGGDSGGLVIRYEIGRAHV